jgi:hypothetical protein
MHVKDRLVVVSPNHWNKTVSRKTMKGRAGRTEGLVVELSEGVVAEM